MNATFPSARVSDYARIERAIRYLDDNFRAQPGLKDIAASVGSSEYHFQRLFRRWVGITPKRFLQYLTLDYAKACLERSHSVLDAAYESGLSGPGRLHDLFVTCEAVTPGTFKRRGEGLAISYGFHPSPFGDCLLATTERGLCWLGFTLQEGREAALAGLKGRWPRAVVRADPRATAPVLERVFSNAPPGGPLTLFLRGTNFQLKVWEALLRVPPGALVSYESLAVRLGRPSATRAVAGAVAGNPIAFVIPCHRVIRKTGAFHGYAYGTPRKRAMLAWEAARFATTAAGAGGGAGIAAS